MRVVGNEGVPLRACVRAFACARSGEVVCAQQGVWRCAHFSVLALMALRSV